jgi:hypothetical protein
MTTGKIGWFSKAQYRDVARFFGLEWIRQGHDIKTFELKPVYVPNELFEHVITSLQSFQSQYGLVEEFCNEAVVGHFVAAVPLTSMLFWSIQIFSPLLRLFEGGLTDVPEMTMKGVLASSRRVEITLFTGPTCVILVGELKHSFAAEESNLLAQIFCEADGTSCSFLVLTTG